MTFLRRFWKRLFERRQTITLVLDPELIELEKDCTVMTGGGGRKYTREMAHEKALEAERLRNQKKED